MATKNTRLKKPKASKKRGVASKLASRTTPATGPEYGKAVARLTRAALQADVRIGEVIGALFVEIERLSYEMAEEADGPVKPTGGAVFCDLLSMMRNEAVDKEAQFFLPTEVN